jgi:hypothetical protein
MIIYLVESILSNDKAFVNKQLAEEYLKQDKMRYYSIKEIELVTDEFMELTLQQPKPYKEFT